jgi:hypothetical protein
MGEPEPGYRCYRKCGVCEAGESKAERRKSRRRGCDRETEGGCRYWVRNEEWGNCVLRVTYGEECDQGEIASILGMSRQAVSKIEVSAWMKLRKELLKRSEVIKELLKEMEGERVMVRNQRNAWVNL